MVLTQQSLESTPNKLLDFGPPLPYPQLCRAYTVEKLTMWQRITEEEFEVVVLRGGSMPSSRLEGFLYVLTDEAMNSLDKYRGVGVNCERKKMPIYVPILDESGQMAQVLAEVYVSKKTYWNKYDLEFKLVQKVPDNSQTLHDRQALLPQRHQPQPVREINERVLERVKQRNDAVAQQIALIRQRELDEQMKLGEEMARPLNRQMRINKIKRSLKEFVYDE